MASNSPTKRKNPNPGPTDGQNFASAIRKRARTHDARALAVQSADSALSATGELDVAAYVGAREYEIRALETGIEKSKGASTSRAFQKVPRSLRRRTASHNVKRVPKRLRSRAKREVRFHLVVLFHIPGYEILNRFSFLFHTNKNQDDRRQHPNSDCSTAKTNQNPTPPSRVSASSPGFEQKVKG